MFPPRSSRGVIVIACLWICALVLWLALNTSLLYRYRFSDSTISPLRTLGFYAALGGIYEIIARMPPADPELFLEGKPDGKPQVINYGRCTVSVRTEDEMSKVNINITSSGELSRILREILKVEHFLPITSSQLADRILDFIDQDDFARDYGAEKDFYEKAKLGYFPYNKPIPAIEMVLLVPGVTWELFWGTGTSLLPSENSFFYLFTVYGNKKSLEVQPEKTEGWKPGGLYRIVAGADCGGDRKVVVYAVVSYNPGQNPHFKIEYLKELL
ncbi:MAG: general secretion pathway protein GspK [Syntrophobacterales bacterium]|nr:general secretion pathway protein GspK [Syntrophobacterales bacterium]